MPKEYIYYMHETKGKIMSDKKMNVESFNFNHTKVIAPYVRLVGVTKGTADEIRKYDVRFCQPNVDYMDMPGLHSLEHMAAEFIRDHTDYVVDWGPMGCQTGFYLTVLNHNDYDEVLEILEKTLNDVLVATSVPACNVLQCGWAANHSLDGAKVIAKEMLSKRSEWSQVFVDDKDPDNYLS